MEERGRMILLQEATTVLLRNWSRPVYLKFENEWFASRIEERQRTEDDGADARRGCHFGVLDSKQQSEHQK